jgi:aspartyl-tRNA(Asn)/glutamyl-tRNA(Gln) amidotransferase subunit B
MSYETVIGLEVHVQLNTKSKIFSGSSTHYGAEPNTQANEVDLALPGTLPVMNKAAVHKAISLGLALGGAINQHSVMARKNYFYPDLPKGYQISQLDLPIIAGGEIKIPAEKGEKTLRIHHAHLEEDAGKSLHERFHGMTGIDLNRAGTPLIEVVSEPDMRSAKEAIAYLKKLHTLVRYLDISDGNMQEGSFRCDANVSIRKPGAELGTRVELKNINSFRFIEKAINLEVERQIDLIESGGSVTLETRLYNPDKHETRAMRSKEEANDYRYFPDPDLPPIHISDAWIASVKADLPELPEAKYQRFQADFSLNADDALQLTNDRMMADFFEALLAKTNMPAKTVANWLLIEVAALSNAHNVTISTMPLDSDKLAGLLNRVQDDTISSRAAKSVLTDMWSSGETADELIASKGLKQVTDVDAIAKLVDEVIENNPDQVAGFKAGKTKLLGFLVGQVIKNSQGKANPQQVNQLLKDRLT